MQVLVTGGGGYLGSCLVSRLLHAGHRVRVFDRFCFGREALETLAANNGCEVVEGDVRRLQEHPELLDGVEAIMHLASLSNDPSCDLDADTAMDVNVESTIELAQRAVRAGVGRFVLASSCSVYGLGVFELLDEESPANPVSTFGKSKLAAETALRAMASPHFTPVVGRTATLFGLAPRMRFDLAVNQMVATAARQGRIEVRGGGNQWRPFIHVRDAARAFQLFLEADAAVVGGEVFNVGADEFNLRIADLAALVAAHFEGIRVDRATDDDDLRNFRVLFGKLKERLHFLPKHTLEEGIIEVRGFLDDPTVDPFDEAFFNVYRMKTLRATPVDEGGEPVAARFVPLARPNLGPEEEEAILTALRGGWITSGDRIAAFERAFADTVNAPHTVAVNSCTAALHLCLAEAGVKAGDEVISPPITWSSTGNTLLNMGVTPVFVDVEADTLNVNPDLVEAAITPRTRAIIPVHMAGQPCDMARLQEIATRHGLPLIEDAAHALGAARDGVPVGATGNPTCFSFYAIKNITTMEGGMIALKDPETAARLRLLAANGMEATAWDRYGRSAVAAPREVVAPGFKFLMGNVSATMGIEQLKKFPQFMAARRRLAQMYRAVLAEIDEIELLRVCPGVEHAWHLMVIRLKLDRLDRSRDEIAYLLRQENIGTGVHFYGLHLHRYYREHLGMKPEDLPEATRVSHEILSLPLHPQMTDKNVHEVVTALKKVIHHVRHTS